jgi:hypothetical protein
MMGFSHWLSFIANKPSKRISLKKAGGRRQKEEGRRKKAGGRR